MTENTSALKFFHRFNVVSNKILIGETQRGMTNVHPLMAKTYSSLSITKGQRYFFPDALVAYHKDIDVYIDPDVENYEDYLKETSRFFYDTNKDGIRGNNEVTAYTLKLYVSTNGLKMKEAFQTLKPDQGQILLFVEDNTGDKSDQIIRISLADDIKDALTSEITQSDTNDVITYLTEKTGLSLDAVRALIKNGKVEETLTFTSSLLIGLKYLGLAVMSPLKAVGWILSKIGEGIAYLKASDSLWDEQAEDYVYSKENITALLKKDPSLFSILYKVLKNDPEWKNYFELLPEEFLDFIEALLQAIDYVIEQYNTFIENNIDAWYAVFEAEDIKESIALLTGLWNGAIDFISGVFSFVGSLIEVPFDLINNYQDVLETLDNFTALITSDDFFENLFEGISLAYEKAKAYYKTKTKEDIDTVRVAYTVGYAVSFIATFFVPFANISKLNVFTKMPKAVQGLVKSLGKKGNEIKGFKGFLKTINQIIDTLSKGKKAAQEFYGGIGDKIGSWIYKNKKIFKLVDKVDNAVLIYVRVLKTNVGYTKCIELVKDGRFLGRWLAIESEAMVKLYTANTYIILNKALRGIGNIKFDKELKAMQKLLDDALFRLPSFKQGTEPLSRSLYLSEKEIEKLFKVGKDFVEKGFMSTTYSERALQQWLIDNPAHNVILKVFGKNGKLIEKASVLTPEAEVLFKSGSKFLVVSIEKGYNYKFSREITEIVLKEK